MKHKYLILTAFAVICGAAACQRAVMPQDTARTLQIPVVLENDATKVNANANTGVCTWTTNDKVAVYVSGTGGNLYKEVTVSSNKIAVPLEAGQTLANYAVYPSGMEDPANFSGDTPGVIYPSTYDFTGHESADTYTMAPMMAVCKEEEMRFYNVGGMLRLAMLNLPAETVKLQVVFSGMSHVCGTCTVSKPGTVNATTAITSGGGNVLTAIGFTYAATLNMNLPIPCGDYSALKAIHVKALDVNDDVVGQVSEVISGSWGTLKHSYARVIQADFNADVLSAVQLSSNAAVTIWKNQTVKRMAKPVYPDGLPYTDCVLTWSASPSGIVSVDEDGQVTPVSAGTATVTATATANLGGETKTASYTVNVNAVTGISVSGADIVKGSTGSVTATITHTTYGDIVTYPSITWSSATPASISLFYSSSMAFYSASGEASANMTANGVAEGSSDITATVPAAVSSTGADLSDTKTLSCVLP